MKDQTNTLPTSFSLSTSRDTNVLSEFRTWADQMDFYRLVIMVAMILIQGCIVAPALLWTMDLSGHTNFIQMSVVTFSSFAILVTLLSVQPMRISIPIYVCVTALQLFTILVNIFSL